MTIVINFSHPFTEAQRDDLRGMIGPDITIIEKMPQFDLKADLVPQVRNLVSELDIDPEDWQARAIIVNLPGLSVAAGIVLAEIHGRTGHFPVIIRMASRITDAGTEFYVAGTINLDGVRLEARQSR